MDESVVHQYAQQALYGKRPIYGQGYGEGYGGGYGGAAYGTGYGQAGYGTQGHYEPYQHPKKLKKSELEKLHCNICDVDIGLTFLQSSRRRIDMHNKSKAHIRNVQKKDGTYVPPPPEMRCDICDCEVNPLMSDQHFLGARHKRNVAKQDNPPVYCDVCDIVLENQQIYETHVKGRKHAWYLEQQQLYPEQFEHVTSKVAQIPIRVQCLICKVDLQSENEAKTHYIGKKHLKNAIKAGTEPDTKKVRGQPVTFNCDLCDVPVNTLKADLHYAGRKHGQRAIETYQSLWAQAACPTTGGYDTERGKDRVDMVFNTKEELDEQLAAHAFLDATMGTDNVGKFFKTNRIICGICLVVLSSKDEAYSHFDSAKHISNCQIENEETDITKYCPLCKIPLETPSVAITHYQGKLHRAKFQMAKEAGIMDEKMMIEMDPQNAIITAQKHARKSAQAAQAAGQATAIATPIAKGVPPATTTSVSAQPVQTSQAVAPGSYQGPKAQTAGSYNGGIGGTSKASNNMNNQWVQGATMGGFNDPSNYGAQSSNWAPAMQTGGNWASYNQAAPMEYYESSNPGGNWAKPNQQYQGGFGGYGGGYW